MQQVSPPPLVAVSPWRAGLGLAVVCAGMMAAPFDAAVNVAFPDITAHFGLEVSDIRWVAIFYVLTHASLLLVCGRLGDLIGYRIVFQAGLAICAAGFVACAMAPTYGLLLAGRVVQGVGIAFVLACAPALATSLYDEGRRTRVLGIYGTAMALGHAVGPLAAGALMERFGWASVFWSRVPLMLGALALSFVIPARRPGGARAALDPVGSVQLAIALAVILAGISLDPGTFGWALPLGLIGAGSLVMAVFVRRQARHPSPIIRPAAFLNPMFALMNVGSVATNVAAFSVVLLVPFHLVTIAKFPFSLSGPMLAIGALGIITGSWLAPRGIAWAGSVRMAALGMVLSSAGLFGMATWGFETPMALMVGSLLVQGAGYGLFLVAYADYATATLPVAERGVAGSLTMVTRALGIVVGASVLLAAHRHFAALAAAQGAARDAAFLAGFQSVLSWVAVVQLVTLAMGAAMARGARSPAAIR